MALDTEDLRRRLADARAALPSAMQPQPAPQPPPPPRTTFDRGGEPFTGSLYRTPVIGYAARILAAVFNMPKILANLSAHYRAYNAEVGELRALIAEQRLELRHAGERIEALETAARSTDRREV